MLDVERSMERSHLLALNIPSTLTNAEIETGFRNLYPLMTRMIIKRGGDDQSGSCQAVIEFQDHKTALEAKRWSGVGSVNLWNQNVKILWAQKDQIKDFGRESSEVKHIVIHNVPEVCDPDDLGLKMHKYVNAAEIISIRAMKTDFVIEFASTQAAFSILSAFDGKFIGANMVRCEWMRNVTSFADFDFELRCICLANYWDPPIFIYGRIITVTNVQLVSVIIKNNCKNQYVTIFLEMSYVGLVDIHSRVCEVLVLYLMESKELPKHNLVFKCSQEYAMLAGVVTDLNLATFAPSTAIMNIPVLMYLDEIAALSKMSYTLIASQLLDTIHCEYKMIIKEKNIFHQFICGIESEDKLLGCIDPSYRMGKPLKYELDSRLMILALCDQHSLSNIDQSYEPFLHQFPKLETPKHFKVDKIQLIPLVNVQRKDVHLTFRPFIEFNQFDSFSPLKMALKKVSEALVPVRPVQPPPMAPPAAEQLPAPRLSVFEAFCGAPLQYGGAAKDPFDYNNFMGSFPQ